MENSTQKSSNTVWQPESISVGDREQMNGHRRLVVWFTGLSGSGKSTLMNAVAEDLHKRGLRTFALDGDNVRHGLCSDLGFSNEDREENIRRIGHLTKLFSDAGLITLAAFISPFRADRQRVRELVGDDRFAIAYCECGLDSCEQRDVKGLYKRARSGLIKDFTGISSPYEHPENPEVAVQTDQGSIEECRDKIVAMILERIALPESASNAYKKAS